MYSQLEIFIEKIVTGFISGECIFNFHFCRKLQKKKPPKKKKKPVQACVCASMEVFFPHFC